MRNNTTLQLRDVTLEQDCRRDFELNQVIVGNDLTLSLYPLNAIYHTHDPLTLEITLVISLSGWEVVTTQICEMKLGHCALQLPPELVSEDAIITTLGIKLINGELRNKDMQLFIGEIL